MNELLGQWLPILVAAVVVFFASFVSWMLLPFHKKDWAGLPDEDGFFKALASVKPGQYIFPHCEDPSKMKDPDYKKKWLAGPHGTIRICSAAPSFGRNLLAVFIFYLVVGVFVAYLGVTTLGPEPAGKLVFQVTGTAAILAYVFAMIPGAIFFGQPLKSLVLDAVDGVVYGLLTGAVFGLLW